MPDYKVNYDVGHFGTDNPATAGAERVPFVVQTDRQRRTAYVNIGIVSGAHGSHVAGIIAGNSLFGGAMSGAAPGAKLVVVRACLFIAGCTSHALIEGMIYLVETGRRRGQHVASAACRRSTTATTPARCSTTA